MNCLLCQRELPVQLSFSELFLLRKPKNALCENCLKTFEKIPEKHCSCCWKAGTNEICSDCQDWQKQGIEIQHQAIFTYNTAMHDFFQQYKFQGDFRLCACFAQFFHAKKGYTLVPVPVSPERFQGRGFNQVTAFLDAAGLSYQELLSKTDSLTQSSLNRAQRLAKENTFTINAQDKLPKKVLLIDDIYTTGTTLQQAASILKAAGVSEVKSFSLCR